MTLPQIHADRIRIASLDTNGVPLPGASGIYVSDALTKLTLKNVYTDGDTIRETNGAGRPCLNYKADDSFDGVDVDIELCSPDPYIMAMLAGGTVLTDVDAQVPGYAWPPIGSITGNGVSVEFWCKRIDNDDLDATYPYARWALPKLRRAKIGDKAFEKALQNSILSGRAVENANWFDGPLNDWPAASDRVVQWLPATSMPAPTSAPITLPAS